MVTGKPRRRRRKWEEKGRKVFSREAGREEGNSWVGVADDLWHVEERRGRRRRRRRGGGQKKSLSFRCRQHLRRALEKRRHEMCVSSSPHIYYQYNIGIERSARQIHVYLHCTR